MQLPNFDQLFDEQQTELKADLETRTASIQTCKRIVDLINLYRKQEVDKFLRQEDPRNKKQFLAEMAAYRNTINLIESLYPKGE